MGENSGCDSLSTSTMRDFREVLWVVMNLVVVIAFSVAIGVAAHEEGLQGPDSEETCSIRDPLMNPTHEVRYGQDTVWQIPADPKAILFLGHGFGRDPFPFFDKSPNCEKCTGMPEDRSIVLDALRRGYAVISVKSLDTGYDYRNLDASEDLEIAVNILNDWKGENSLEGLPLAAFGSSSGGFFATIFPLRVPTIAIVLMCSQGQEDMIENAAPETFPPTFFVYMGFDEESVITKERLSGEMTTAADVEKSMAMLNERGVSVEGKHILPSPVTPLFFTKRIPCMTDEASEEMQMAYKAEGWLTSDDYLAFDPYGLDWRAPLRKWNALPLWDETYESCPASPICYELCTAYAFHGTTGDANEEFFPWMDSLVTLSDNQRALPLSSSR